jgi:excisionase family DNA binding protein
MHSGRGKDDFVALGETARILKHSQEYVRKLTDAGVLNAIWLGNGHRIFRREEVERLARERGR